MFLLQLQSVTPLSIKANHTSPDGISIQNITLTFIPTTLVSGCRVSILIKLNKNTTTLLDGGLNYCNLYKLLSASGLSSAIGFVELTNEWACLGYGLVKCK
uniref:Uncharacterized protein n=1 Tax=Nothobranchius furzeri TaxID=105023 RepID=A0A8C6PB92_NOTFU